MGFYIRKGFNFGPVRLNLSKSGLGVSGGVKGARIGTGPRGAYVHAGREGLYYRKQLKSGKGRRGGSSRETAAAEAPTAETLHSYSAIDSGSTMQMAPQSHQDLLEAWAARRGVGAYFIGGIFVALLMLAWAAMGEAPGLALLLAAAAGVGGWAVDKRRRRLPLSYQLDPVQEPAYTALVQAFESLRGVHVWHVEGEARDLDPKETFTAAELLKRRRIVPSRQTPTGIDANINPPALDAGAQRLHFMPEAVYINDRAGMGIVPYAELQVIVRERVLPDAAPPGDAEVVDQTWRYVNKDGSPDKRYKDNPAIPLVRYEELRFTSASGLRECYMLSRQGPGAAIKAAVEALAGLGK